ATRHKIKMNKAKHRARLGIGEIDGVGVVLAMPLTFMNNSGQSVAPMMRDHGLKPDRVLIVSDDLDMDLARVRLKPKGGSGGHNGHKSIIKNLGTEDYPRLKIGIHSDKRDETTDFVLSRFTAEERVDINGAIKRSVESIECIVTQGLELALSRTNEA
ncbi:MAG TPA: aminoacyl-tRNA hydrolase, partial [Fimbriimonas sp.]|nr:aminoacyl-tRNA hydrolase [Fimbriimonas sp.]